MSKEPLVGQLLGHYRLLEQIGAGGMGVVYRAHDEHLNRDVAAKVLPAGSLANEETRKRFKQEAHALARLNHPNIATIFDFDCEGTTDFLVMELLTRQTLADKLLAGPLPPNVVIEYGIQMAEGLAAAHQQGILHRDLKPGNLGLTAEGRVKLLDFGLAKLLTADPADVTQSRTGVGLAKGTLAYMAPEQLRGENIDTRVDIYAGIDVFPSELLRRHVGEGALGESHACPALGYIGGVGRQQFRQAEIKQLHSALGGQTEVSWFQIPVQDSLLMRGRQAFGHLNAVLDDDVWWQWTGEEFVREGLTGQQFHDQEVCCPLAIEIKNGRNIRMVQPGERVRLLLEALARFFVGQASRRKNFCRDVAIEVFVVGAIDHAHPPRSNLFQETIVPQKLSNQRFLGHRWER